MKKNCALVFGITSLSAICGDGIETGAFDGNHDGKVNALDLDFARLRVWRDLDQDGVSDEGELFSLAELGITSINVTGNALGVTTPSGNTLREQSTFTRADGSTGNIFEALFPTDLLPTAFNGDRGVANDNFTYEHRNAA
jgi:hypothetical protein